MAEDLDYEKLDKIRIAYFTEWGKRNGLTEEEKKKDGFNYPKGFDELTSDEYNYVKFNVKPFDYDENALKLWEYVDKYLEIITIDGDKFRGLSFDFFSRLNSGSDEDAIALKINYIDNLIDINAEKYTLWTNYDCCCFVLSEIDKITIKDDIPYIEYLAEFVTIHTSNGVYTGFVSDIKNTKTSMNSVLIYTILMKNII
ncbi:hypothetical protein K2V61_01755 [Staphylococcus simulans]|uniref:hypothetical protein n=1 Tax=Staphylococcus simulans TaxID=1286 RepID=UPI001E590902|nr:hypothetical protein [Staphylococcus simulans]MCD8914285.1 hypothetical protein [Staphylococcus simulans]